MKHQKQKSGKNTIWYSNKKNKVPRNKPNQGDKRPVLRKLHNTEELHLHSGILCSRKKEGVPTLCDSMDGTGKHYAK